MLKFITSKKARLIGGLILFGGIYAFYFRKDDNSAYEASIAKNLTVAPTAAPAETKPDKIPEDSLLVRNSYIQLGDSADQVIKAFGTPGRIDATEDNFDYYIYNNDYSRMAFIAVKEDTVIGFYSDSTDFCFQNVRYGDSIRQVNSALGKNYSEADILTYETDTYTAKLLVDRLEGHSVTGIYVMSKESSSSETEEQLKQYTETVNHNIEQMSYDLANSIRSRHGMPALSWSSSAGIAARKHSEAMAAKAFFGHTDPELRTPGGRLFAEGIGYRDCAENIIGGYDDAILSNHAFYNSDKQRKNILSTEFRYMGVGFAYDSKSKYHTYITQLYYR